MGINNKFLMVLRQETAGFSENGEATGYLKFEWLPSACRLAFGSKALTGPGKGEYLCALYLNGQIFQLGPIRVLPEAAFADFNLKLPMPGMDDILAAGIFYKENGFLYPVITGHRGSGSTWHKDFTDKLCHSTGTRLGQNYQRWSYTASDGEVSEGVTSDTIKFEPEMVKQINQNNIHGRNTKISAEAAAKTDYARQPAQTSNGSPARMQNNESEEGAVGQRAESKPSDNVFNADTASEMQKNNSDTADKTAPEYGFEALPDESADFYEQNKEHFERLLTDNTQLDELCDMIPGSKWVKVEYTEGEEKGHYIVGIIYDEEGAPMHICYGVPGQFALAPPENLAKYCQWLPASIKDPQGEGYWVLYQSAKTGQTYGEE